MYSLLLVRVRRGNPAASLKFHQPVQPGGPQDLARLIRHVLRKAEEEISSIRSGEARVSPASFDGREPCAYCDYRAACLFDARIDAGRVRRMKNIKWNEVFDRIAVEDDGTEEQG